MNADRRWPIGLTLVLVLTVAGNVGVYLVANRGDAMAMEPDYYRRAVAWDSALADVARSRALGWTVAARLGAPGAAPVFDLAVRDAAGAMVSGAQVRVEGFAIAHSRQSATGALREQQPGRYVIAVPVERAEWYEFRVVVARQGDRYVARLRCFPGVECGGP